MRHGPSYDTIVRTETAISSAVYALVPTALLWLAGAAAPMSLAGTHPLLPALILPAGVGTFMMTVALTLLIRARVRRGALPHFDGSKTRGIQRFVRIALPGRASALALVAIALFVPAALAAVAVLGVLPLSTAGFAIFNIVYGACIGLAMTPYVVRAPLADRPRNF